MPFTTISLSSTLAYLSLIWAPDTLTLSSCIATLTWELDWDCTIADTFVALFFWNDLTPVFRVNKLSKQADIASS
jgi:hypothetical protein